jgi:3-phosphoshikimate 1-carboxyvinyltransferase
MIEVEGELISKPYIEITLNLLARFGIEVGREGFQRFTIPAGSRYRSPGEIHVEGDASSASYFVALGAIGAHGGAPVHIDGVGHASIQGDIRFVEAAAAMGAEVRSGPNWLEVRRGRWPLQALELDCNHIPDAAMTLAVMALFTDPAGPPMRLTGIGSWRVKETDRIAAMAAELRKLGAAVVEGNDFIEVRPPARWRPASIRTYDDHRMAMSLALAAFNPLAAEPGRVPVRIEDPACTAKTFPEYFESLLELVSAEPDDIPVITVDGPSASGKGTLASMLAARLGYHLLDSGSLYRAAALAVLQDGIDPTDPDAVARAAGLLALKFDGGRIFLRGADVTEALRHEEVGAMASRVASLPAVREALHGLQLAFRRPPGLVADGRDMGTAVFPGAALKVFLTASAAQRAERRHKQLIEKGLPATLSALRAELEARDLRDRSRSASPLRPAEDALELDNSDMSIDESVGVVLAWWAGRRPFQG